MWGNQPTMSRILLYTGEFPHCGVWKQRRGGELFPTISAVTAAQGPKMVVVWLTFHPILDLDHRVGHSKTALRPGYFA
jgi:hypothetical protein